MAAKFQAIRGMFDILPEETILWRYVENNLRETAEMYGYREIRFPVIETTDLFKRSVGEVTDIVEKEMYTFSDKNGESLTLRPEGTAGCVRACIENSLIYKQTQRLWYSGPIFRHERPQKGRYRQFHQFGVEAFGIAEPEIDAEMILLSARLFERFNMSKHVTLEINSLGSSESRSRYKELLVEYFSKHIDILDEDSKRRLYTNPLRILDSKNPQLFDIIQVAPKMLENIDDESKKHFERVCSLIENAGIKFTINERLVRGLDYYSKTVFEWKTDKLGAQGTVCAGGRYDDLVNILGGDKTPAIGFALGYERLIALISELNLVPAIQHTPDIYMILTNDVARARGIILAEQLHTQFPGLHIITNCDSSSIKSQFKKADKSNATLAFVISDDELANNYITVKYLREDKPQSIVKFDEVYTVIDKLNQ